MSENTINAALRGMGYSHDVHTAHGFRAMARTIMDEVLGERVDLFEHQLAHTMKDTNGRAPLVDCFPPLKLFPCLG